MLLIPIKNLEWRGKKPVLFYEEFSFTIQNYSCWSSNLFLIMIVFDSFFLFLQCLGSPEVQNYNFQSIYQSLPKSHRKRSNRFHSLTFSILCSKKLLKMKFSINKTHRSRKVSYLNHPMVLALVAFKALEITSRHFGTTRTVRVTDVVIELRLMSFRKLRHQSKHLLLNSADRRFHSFEERIIRDN